MIAALSVITISQTYCRSLLRAAEFSCCRFTMVMLKPLSLNNLPESTCKPLPRMAVVQSYISNRINAGGGLSSFQQKLFCQSGVAANTQKLFRWESNVLLSQTRNQRREISDINNTYIMLVSTNILCTLTWLLEMNATVRLSCCLKVITGNLKGFLTKIIWWLIVTSHLIFFFYPTSSL